LQRLYYKGAAGAILVYDITKRESFEKIHNRWLGNIKNYLDQNIIVLMIGNKSDLKEQRKVSTQEGADFAQNHGKLK